MADNRTYAAVASKPPVTPSPAHMPSTKTKTQYGPKMSVKFIFKIKNDSNKQTSKIHRELLLTMTKIEPSVKFFDNDSKQVVPDNITDGGMSDHFNYALVKRRFSKSIVVCHDLLCPKSLHAMRKLMSQQLKMNKAALLLNYWDDPDVRDIGWFCGIHPKYHNRDCLTDLLQKHLQQAEEEVPKFRLHPKKASCGKGHMLNSVRAVHIECSTKDTQKLRHLLSLAYKSNALPGQFIPTNLSFVRSESAYKNWITRQTTYLNEHRNIPISNVSRQEMRETMVEYEGEKRSIRDLILTSPLIKCLSSTARTESDGLWNLSTTSELYNAAVSFVNKILDRPPSTSSSPIDGNAELSDIDDYNDFLCNDGVGTETTTSTTQSTNEPSDTQNDVPNDISSKPMSVQSSISNASGIVKELTNIRTELVKQIADFHTGLQEEIQKSHELLRQEIAKQIAKDKSILRKETEEKTKLAVRASLQLAREECSSLVSKMRSEIMAEVREEVKRAIQLISPNPRFRKQSRTVDADCSDVAKRIFPNATSDSNTVPVEKPSPSSPTSDSIPSSSTPSDGTVTQSVEIDFEYTPPTPSEGSCCTPPRGIEAPSP